MYLNMYMSVYLIISKEIPGILFVILFIILFFIIVIEFERLNKKESNSKSNLDKAKQDYESLCRKIQKSHSNYNLTSVLLKKEIKNIESKINFKKIKGLKKIKDVMIQKFPKMPYQDKTPLNEILLKLTNYKKIK